MAQSSNQTTPPRGAGVSPMQRDYLRQQSYNILTNGGSEADVVSFLQTEGHRPNITVAPDADRDIGLIEGLSMSALQGLTFGFGDETFGRFMPGGTDAYRRDLAQWASDHGKLNLLGELVGGLATGAGSLVAKGGARAASTLGRTVGLGAAGGAASAAGNTTGGLSDRAKAAIFGGAFGGAFTGGLAGMGRVIGTVARPAARQAAEGMLPATVAEAVERGIPGLGSAEDHAREIVWRSLIADGINTADDLLTRIDDMAATGAPVTLADVGGPSLLRLAAEASSSRSPAQQQFVETVMERQAAQGGRTLGAMVQSVFRGTKLGLQNAHEATEMLARQQDELARPMYTAAHQQTVELSERAREILRHPKLQEAWARGKNIADLQDFSGRANEGALKVPSLPTNDLREQLATRLREMGVAEDRIVAQVAQIPQEFPAAVPVRAIDMMQRGLRQVIDQGIKKEGTLDAEDARNLRALLNEVLEEADEKVPAFGAARLTYRGFESAQDAIEAGREMGRARLHPTLMQRQMSELSPSDRAFARLGYIQNISDNIYNVRGRETRNFARDFFGANLFGGRSDEADRIRVLFADDPAAGEDFMRRLAAEARISMTASEGIKGARGAIGKEAEEAIEGAALPQVRMNEKLTAAGIVRDGLMRTKGAFLRRVYDNISLLLAKGIDDPRELEIAAQVMEETHRRANRGFGLAGRAAPIAIGAQAGEGAAGQN